MAYPQYPGRYEPYPAAGYSTSGPPGGGTAITAGVLACLGVLANLLGGGASIWLGLTEYGSDLDEYDSTGLLANPAYYTFALITGVIAILVALVLGVGAVLLFTRKTLGRTLIVAGCAVVIVSQIAGVIVTVAIAGSISEAGMFSGVSGLIGLVFPITTAVLALVPPTTRWLAYRPSEFPQQPGYPQAGFPPPGYPQHGYPQANQGGYPQGPPFGYPQPGPAITPPPAAPEPSPPYQPPPSDPQAKPDDQTWKRPGNQ
ncbi:hypothetical protein [Nocardia sp. NPDC050710]|uniref:hypothetical protein n=1 Tax=Nocardia sp. NPDC050710 TaxID=3157220 RepID=UPI0033D0E25D